MTTKRRTSKVICFIFIKTRTLYREQTFFPLQSMDRTTSTASPDRHSGIFLTVATISCKSTLNTVPYFGINGLSLILCLWSPLHPLSKLLAIQDHAQNLEEQLWMGGRREVSVISQRPVTSSDLKRERLFFLGSVSTFLELVVALKSLRWSKLWFRRKERTQSLTACLSRLTCAFRRSL